MDLAGTADCTRTGVSPRFTAFVAAMTAVLDDARGDERHILHHGTPHVLELVAHDDWLPDHLAQPVPGAYGQYLLYRDPDVRFTAVAFVWDAGAGTPIHDHKVWGIVGALRGAELAERFELLPEGGLRSLGTALLRAGEIDRVSPRVGDIHQVRNALGDRSSISIHIYGGDLTTFERDVYDRETGRVEPVVSKPYDNELPLL